MTTSSLRGCVRKLGQWASSEEVEAADSGCRMSMAAIRAVSWRGSGFDLDLPLLLYRPFGFFLVDDKFYGLDL